MAVSRGRGYSISELQLPHVFLKERPFETTGKLSQAQRQKKQDDDDSDQCCVLRQKFTKITVEKDPSTTEEKEECQSTVWCQEESSHLVKKFAPHQMALERFQEDMRMFLRGKARELQPIEEMSEQELARYLHMMLELFRDIKLEELFRISFFYEICLRRIRCFDSEELTPLREAILETQEVIQTFFKLLISDREWTLETQFHHDNLENSLMESRQKVGALFEESVFFRGQLPDQDIILYTDIKSRISYALGLNIDFLDKLNTLDDELKSHWTLEEWICNYLTNNYEDIENEDLKKNLSKKLLIEIGFRDNSEAINTILNRSAMLSGHVDPIEFVKRFVKDELKYHHIFAQELYLLPYTDQACTQCEIKFSDQKLYVIHINFARVGESEEPYELNITKHLDELRDGDSVILFHGTDHSSAIDILNRAIDINQGMPKHDFSDGFGFYLTDNFEHSETWSFSQTRKPTVLVFKVPKKFLEDSNCLELSGEEKMSDWLQIVTAYRSGRPSKKLRNRMKSYDIIRGPVSQPSEDEKKFKQMGNSNQVCITNDDCADKIREFLHTIIFYE